MLTIVGEIILKGLLILPISKAINVLKQCVNLSRVKNIFATLYVESSSPKDKRINGFHYGDARKVIRNFADHNFEALRLDIKQGNTQALSQLASKLRMHDNQKRDVFIKKSQRLYKKIYLEPVVVALMVHS